MGKIRNAFEHVTVISENNRPIWIIKQQDVIKIYLKEIGCKMCTDLAAKKSNGWL